LRLDKHYNRLYAATSESEWFVLDFKDAFWLLPLLPRERKYFVAFYKGKFLVWLRVGQGSRNGPQLWGRAAALLGRFTQSMFSDREARFQIYIDDPIAIIRGNRIRRDRIIAMASLVWLILGVELAFAKGQRGVEVIWTGHQLSLKQAVSVTAAIKEEFLNDFLVSTETLLQQNIMSLQELRSYAGRANHVANLLWVWRPFLEELYAAIGSPVGSQAKHNKVWVRQIQTSLSWLRLFLRRHAGKLERVYQLEYYESAPEVLYTFDASPWGMGGYLEIKGKPVSWFAVALTPDDEERFGQSIGDHRGQQVWENLAAPVGLRLWKEHWINGKAAISIRGDNVGALTLVRKLKSSKATSLIARELALLYGEASFEPKRVLHTPGLCNKIADALSRVFMPGAAYSVPESLVGIPSATVPPRTVEYYQSLTVIETAPLGLPAKQVGSLAQ
jgi:hypothetical protein